MIGAKRGLDLVVAATGLLLLAPLLLLLAGLVRWRLGKPVLFRQTRPGLGGKPFLLLKFRTMRDLRDSQGQLLPDPQRLTRFGRFLRASSLDELPELLNILKGDMSLVGPRPLLPEYLPWYTPAEAARHQAPPGLTGWAQINGRNALSWEEKFALDLWYVQHRSLRLDLWILLRTLALAFRWRGISAHGHETMPRLDQQRAARRQPDPKPPEPGPIQPEPLHPEPTRGGA